jgi:hypothetical protein
MYMPIYFAFLWSCKGLLKKVLCEHTITFDSDGICSFRPGTTLVGALLHKYEGNALRVDFRTRPS